MKHEVDGYTLIDSGGGRKLERYGGRTVSRPSTLSSWQRRCDDSTWLEADASFDPPDHWSYSNDSFTRWIYTTSGVKLELELMSNGQLGIFPEHALYLPLLAETIQKLRSRIGSRTIKILNLFAYTGLATCYCAMQGDVQVTHVDLSKRAIEWAKRNAELNQLGQNQIRWIVDDALAFMAREHRKNNLYDIVIIDPPSFSRVSKNNSWTLEEKIPDITHLFLNVLDREASGVFLTNHSTASTGDIARNIALDFFRDDTVTSFMQSLSLAEAGSKRLLPAGSLVFLSHGIS